MFPAIGDATHGVQGVGVEMGVQGVGVEMYLMCVTGPRRPDMRFVLPTVYCWR